MSDSSIILSNVDAIYDSSSNKKRKALSNITIEIGKGDSVGVIGANGSGKSTLLKILGGSMPPVKGQVKINGENLTLLNRKAGLIYKASLKENAYIKGASLGLKSKELDSFIETCLRASYLEERKDDSLNSLSTGMTGRYNLVLNSQIVKPITILDEWIGTLEMAQLGKDSIFHRLVNETEILVVASHNETLIRKVCNKVALLDGGKLLYFGDDFKHAFTELDRLKNIAPSSGSTEDFDRLKESKIPVHFIHPGKTGGYVVKKVLQNVQSDKYEFILHGIHTKVNDIPKGEKLIFFTRNHQERFCRAFINRKNKGAPFYSTDWTEQERTVFSYYNEANDLAEDMSSENLKMRCDAYRSMGLVNFISSPLTNHFGDEKSIDHRADDILFIGDADSLLSSLKEMLVSLKQDPTLLDQLDKDTVTYFAEKYADKLSEQAKSNLDDYYHMDIDVNQYLKNICPN